MGRRSTNAEIQKSSGHNTSQDVLTVDIDALWNELQLQAAETVIPDGYFSIIKIAEKTKLSISHLNNVIGNAARRGMVDRIQARGDGNRRCYYYSIKDIVKNKVLSK